jgi:hypothetical protein
MVFKFTSPPRPHRSVHEPLGSYGSYRSASMTWSCLTQWLLPSLVDHQVRLIETTPLLHPHYGTSSLLWVVPPLCPASVLSPLWVLHLDFSLDIGTTASHVPHESLDQGHTIFMPEPPRQSAGSPWACPGVKLSSSFDVVFSVSTPHQWFVLRSSP